VRYQVRCECGESKGVSASDAGSSVACGCGRTIDIPSLHKLRMAAGETGLSPAVQIQSLLLQGRLPGTRECARCGRETDETCRVSVWCEQAQMEPGGPARAEAAAGCALGWFVPSFLVRGRHAEPVQRGEDVAFALPLPVCEACDTQLTAPADVKQALRTVPDYAALLDRYPDAQVVRC
jgi:hypothetical protein